MTGLIVPKWVPDLVATSAKNFYAEARAQNSRGKTDLIQRLTSDPRMQIIWTELTKRSRTDCTKFYYPLCEDKFERIEQHPKEFADRTSRLRDLAIVQLFERAIRLGDIGSARQDMYYRSSKIDALKRTVKNLQLQVEWLADDLSETYTAVPRSAKIMSVKKAALKALSRFDEFAEMGPPLSPRLRLRVFSLGMIDKTNQLFDQPLAGIVAHFASVALEDDVTSDQVKGWLDAPLGDCPPQR